MLGLSQLVSRASLWFSLCCWGQTLLALSRKRHALLSHSRHSCPLLFSKLGPGAAACRLGSAHSVCQSFAEKTFTTPCVRFPKETFRGLGHRGECKPRCGISPRVPLHVEAPSPVCFTEAAACCQMYMSTCLHRRPSIRVNLTTLLLKIAFYQTRTNM